MEFIKQHKKAILDNINVDYYLVSDDSCVDNIISICFKSLRGETIEHIMETKGYLIGTGSACNSKAAHNRVLSTIVKPDYLQGAIRISFDSEISVENCVQIRDMSFFKYLTDLSQINISKTSVDRLLMSDWTRLYGLGSIKDSSTNILINNIIMDSLKYRKKVAKVVKSTIKDDDNK